MVLHNVFFGIGITPREDQVVGPVGSCVTADLGSVGVTVADSKCLGPVAEVSAMASRMPSEAL